MEKKWSLELFNRGTRMAMLLVMVLGIIVLTGGCLLSGSGSDGPLEPESWILVLEDFEAGTIQDVSCGTTPGKQIVLDGATHGSGNSFALKLPYEFSNTEQGAWRSVYIAIKRDGRNIDVSKADVLEFWINNDGGAVTDGKVQVTLQCFDTDMTNPKNYSTSRIALTSTGWHKVTVSISDFKADGVSIPEAELKRVTRVQFVLGPSKEGAGYTLFDDIVFREL
jgi:hypothetical protein